MCLRCVNIKARKGKKSQFIIFLKTEMEKKLQNLLSILTKGNPEEVRGAKKEIDKLWHKNSKSFTKSACVVFEYLPKFNQIEKPENQAAFASGLSLFFLALGDEHFDTLKDFTLQVIQHPHGHVRESIRKTADWLFMSLTSRAEPFVYPEGKRLTNEQKIIQKKAQDQYLNLAKEIEFLIYKYDEGIEDVEYIDEMKPSINKSLQLFLSRLTESNVYRKIVERTRPLPYEIAKKKEEIEDRLSTMLKEAGRNFDLDDIKEIIYNEDGQDSLTDVIAMFDSGQGVAELENVLELVNEAWNYFPHKILGGLSPSEKVLEYKQKDRNQLN